MRCFFIPDKCGLLLDKTVTLLKSHAAIRRLTG